jgi:hypothetical protein
MAKTGNPDGLLHDFTIKNRAISVRYEPSKGLNRTSILGAALLMAILGGAIATQLRAGSPLPSHTLFSVYLGVTMWGGLWLRDPTLRRIFPWRSAT